MTFAVAAVMPLVLANRGDAQVPYAEANVNASATGTLVHAGLLQSGDTRLVDGEVSFSGAAYNSQGLTAPLLNEMQRPFSAANPGKLASGRGSPLEVGLGVTPKDDNQIIIPARADTAAPGGAPVTKEIGPIPAGPLAWATLLRGTSAANAQQGICALGNDLSFGRSFAADAQLLDAGTSTDAGLEKPVLAVDAPKPDRAVANSQSRTLFVSQKGKDGKLQGPNFGVMSEVRQTVAPVTFFKGTENEFTIEVLGEWVLQTVATGLGGGAYVHYGPEKVTPQTPILRLITSSGTQTFAFQDIFGAEGLVIPIPGLAEIAIGEDPRAIGGDADSKPQSAGDGTSVAAAVDVVRVKLLPGAPVEAADVRVGHMEAKAAVPAGGVSCPVPITKTPDPSSVAVGGSFTTTFTVNNPFKCTLKGVSITDAIRTEGAARYTVESTDPAADVSPGQIKWANLGDVKPGQTKTVTAVFKTSGGAGRIVDAATALATLADCAGEGATVAGVDVSVVGASVNGTSGEVSVPVGGETTVGAAVAQPTSPNNAPAPSTDQAGELPRTGSNVMRLIEIALALLAVGFAASAIRSGWNARS
jgi:hypothetical protein